VKLNMPWRTPGTLSVDTVSVLSVKGVRLGIERKEECPVVARLIHGFRGQETVRDAMHFELSAPPHLR
jgi:hypothetical protein